MGCCLCSHQRQHVGVRRTLSRLSANLHLLVVEVAALCYAALRANALERLTQNDT